MSISYQHERTWNGVLRSTCYPPNSLPTPQASQSRFICPPIGNLIFDRLEHVRAGTKNNEPSDWNMLRGFSVLELKLPLEAYGDKQSKKRLPNDSIDQTTQNYDENDDLIITPTPSRVLNDTRQPTMVFATATTATTTSTREISSDHYAGTEETTNSETRRAQPEATTMPVSALTTEGESANTTVYDVDDATEEATTSTPSEQSDPPAQPTTTTTTTTAPPTGSMGIPSTGFRLPPTTATTPSSFRYSTTSSLVQTPGTPATSQTQQTSTSSASRTSTTSALQTPTTSTSEVSSPTKATLMTSSSR